MKKSIIILSLFININHCSSMHIPFKKEDSNLMLGQSGGNMQLKLQKSFNFPPVGRAKYTYYLYYNSNNKKRYLAGPTKDNFIYMELSKSKIVPCFNPKGHFIGNKKIKPILQSLGIDIKTLLNTH